MKAAGVIGWPVAHSKSPLIHRFWLAKLGIDGDYGRFAVAPENLGEWVRALRASGLVGVNVTVPHKVAVLEHIDSADGWVKDCGAANCLTLDYRGGVGASNTDVLGLIELFGPLDLGGHPAVLIGAGGAARAASNALMYYRQGPLTLMNRSAINAARMLADTGGGGLVQPLDAPLPEDTAILINASTLGMVGHPALRLDLTALPDHAIVFDMVYAPLDTPLLAAARARGLRTIDGLAMLIGQAAASFELFFGAPAPRKYDVELRALLTA